MYLNQFSARREADGVQQIDDEGHGGCPPTCADGMRQRPGDGIPTLRHHPRSNPRRCLGAASAPARCHVLVQRTGQATLPLRNWVGGVGGRPVTRHGGWHGRRPRGAATWATPTVVAWDSGIGGYGDDGGLTGHSAG